MCLLRCGIRIWFISVHQRCCCPPGRPGKIGATCTDGRGRAKLQRLPADIDDTEPSALLPGSRARLTLHLQIDGRTVANVVQGRRYDHSIPAGRRVLTVSAVPNYYFYQPTSTVLNVRPGQTYVFTALWQDSDRVVLVPSALPPGQP